MSVYFDWEGVRLLGENDDQFPPEVSLICRDWKKYTLTEYENEVHITLQTVEHKRTFNHYFSFPHSKIVNFRGHFQVLKQSTPQHNEARPDRSRIWQSTSCDMWQVTSDRWQVYRLEARPGRSRSWPGTSSPWSASRGPVSPTWPAQGSADCPEHTMIPSR